MIFEPPDIYHVASVIDKGKTKKEYYHDQQEMMRSDLTSIDRYDRKRRR